MRYSILLVGGLWLFASLVALGQQVSIEELERQLEAKEAEQAAAQRRAATERQRAAQLAVNGGFEDAGSGLIRDTTTGLRWTQTDNGSKVNWGEANTYCQSKGMRLPTIDELAAIRRRAGAGSTPCGAHVCSVSSMFRLTNTFYWSGTMDGSKGAWGLHLPHGARISKSLDYSFADSRVLCVDRS